jgi:glutamate racemase
MENYTPIGFFDSGYGGLTILSEVRQQIPSYDFIYLGDNARAPYGPRSFDVVYEFTLEAVEYLFNQGCELVILACNTASAKALRTIQQKILPQKYPTKRVLGVIRPSTEAIQSFTKTNHVGILATEGTVKSESYVLEIAKFSPETQVIQHACPIWVPLIENNKHDTRAGKMLIEEDIHLILQKDPQIDTLILACTHYPILKPFIETIVPEDVKVIAQGPIIAEKLLDYLKRHPEIESRCSKGNSVRFLTTENAHVFDQNATNLMKFEINSQHIKL